MQTPFDTLFEQVQPDTTKILTAPFLISGRISKRALTFQHPFPSRSPISGRTAFFVFLEHYPVPQKGHWRKWRQIVKNPNQANSKPNRTRPEYRSHTGPPARTEKSVCTASPSCEGCSFPGHGFLCQGEDGECMRTRLMKLSDAPNVVCMHHLC